jgi:plastocyanin
MLIAEREAAPTPAFFFEPTGLCVEPGDTVKFNMATPHHNVVAYHSGFGFVRRVPNGVPPFPGPPCSPSAVTGSTRSTTKASTR